MTHRSKRTPGSRSNVGTPNNHATNNTVTNNTAPNNTDSRIVAWARNTLANPSDANYAPDMRFNFDYQRGFDDALHHIINTFEKKD